MKLNKLMISLGLLSFFGIEAMAQEPPPPSAPPIVQKIPIADGPEGLGLGIAAGYPTGIAIAHRPIPSFTTAGMFGYSLSDARLHAHCDFLYRLHKLQPVESDITIDISVGAGPTLNLGASNDTGLGIRTVGVASINFYDKPFDVYWDIAPVIGLIPETAIFLNTSLGIRGWFVPPNSGS